MNKFFYLRRRLCLCFCFHLSYPNLVAANTPSEKKKPPIYINNIECVTNPQIKPIAALTNSDITNTSHLSTNSQKRFCMLFNFFLTNSGSAIIMRQNMDKSYMVQQV